MSKERAGDDVAVVVSAMGDTTDHLIDAAELASRGDRDGAERVYQALRALAIANAEVVARELGVDESVAASVTRELEGAIAPLPRLLDGLSLLREKTPQSLDAVMSFGERLSAIVVSALLRASGTPSAFIDSRDWTVTDATFGAAVVDWPATEARAKEAWAKLRRSPPEPGGLARTGERGAIGVTTGFLGRTPDGRTTTLGRNGSDYTAALLARGLGATELQIWTDVSGVMSADPGLVRDARPLDRLSYMEALELANFGARMFHPRTMIPLIEGNIPLRIRNTMAPGAAGTLVDAEGSKDRERATSVTSLEKLALIEVAYRRISMLHPLSGRVLSALDRSGITVWMATHSAHGQGVAVVIPNAEATRAVAAIEAEVALERLRGEVDPPAVRAPLTLLTLVAEAMGQTPNVAARFFGALGAQGINVYASGQGASSRSISCAIDAADTALAVQTVHTSFHLAHQRASIFLMGRGTVGRELLAQIDSARERLDREHGVLLTVVGIADSGGFVIDAAGVDRAAKTAPGSITDALDRMRALPVPILVDCTAADRMEETYGAAFERGLHVVAANKKPLAGSMAAWRALMASSRAHHRSYLYETTVGASLPVIETLKDLVRTGDTVKLIEGSFSGTLGYLTNQMMAGVALSKAVATARELGYSEPEPQDDLSGLDVARKALILARELGIAIEPDGVRVEPFVDASLLRIRDVGAFLEALKDHDPAHAARIAAAKQRGEVIRYVARIELAPGGPATSATLSVGPQEVASDHPAAALRGSEAFVAFTTARYAEYPLIVRGAGAGGAVTAAGVLADILKVAQRARGR